MMRHYVDYLGTKATGGILSHGLGDWYDFGPNDPGFSQLTPIALTATAFYYRDLVLLDEVARLVGAPERFAARSAEVKEAFNKRFFHPDTNQYADGSQCAGAMALAMGLAPADRRDAVLANLVSDVRAHGNHLTAGDVGYTYLLRALAEGGRSDVIWDMATQQTAPSYADQLTKGATALTEAWDAKRSSSQNHFMLGHIEEWFYRDLAGIGQAPGDVGFARIEIRPQVVGDVTWVKASYRSARGLIAVEWRIVQGTLALDVQVPRGAEATVYVPSSDLSRVTADAGATGQGDGVFKVAGGKWRFTGPWM
jgi:alpha-L-rhamnosidase